MNRLVREELRFQAGFPGIAGDPGGRLGEVRERLRALTQLGDRPGHICIPDTNALLRYTRFDQLPWAERVHAALVRLVIPIAVIDELDAKKYAPAGGVPATPHVDRQVCDGLPSRRLLPSEPGCHRRSAAR